MRIQNAAWLYVVLAEQSQSFLRRAPRVREDPPAVPHPVGMLHSGPPESELLLQARSAVESKTGGSKETLNLLFEQAQSELDLVANECALSSASLEHQLEFVGREMATYATAMTQTVAYLSQTGQTMHEAQTSALAVKDLQDRHVYECQALSREYEEQLKLLQADADATAAAKAASSCSEGAALAQVKVAKCENGHYSLAGTEALAGIKSKAGLAAVQRALSSLHTKSKKHADKSVLLQAGQEPLPEKEGEGEWGREDEGRKEEYYEPMPVAQHYPAKTSEGPPVKCLATVTPACPVVLDALSSMQGSVEDAILSTRQELGRHQRSCDGSVGELNDQMHAAYTQVAMAQSRLAEYSARKTSATESLSMTAKQHNDAVGEFQAMKEQCHGKVTDATGQLCAIKHVRASLLELGGEAGGPIQDCEVGEWETGECNVACGEGGFQVLTRPVLAEPEGGAACPPTMLTRPCNQFPCPVNCLMEEWSGWSACSADCSGGVKQRVRYITKEAQHGGAPCEDEQESQECNVKECLDLTSRDACIEHLANWGEWSGCSKACEGGVRVRHRPLGHIFEGNDDVCPGPDDETRNQALLCNKDRCGPELSCASKLDLIFLLDGSGSVSDELWGQQVGAVQKLITKIEVSEELSKIGAIVFAGEVTQVSELSADPAAVEAAVGGAAKGTLPETKAAPAMEHGINLISMSGRQNAQAVLVLVTDGELADAHAAAEAAMRAKERGIRILVVTVGESGGLEHLEKIASFPALNNVIGFGSFEQMQEDMSVNRLVSDLCPVVNGNERPEEAFPEKLLQGGRAPGRAPVPAQPVQLAQGAGLEVGKERSSKVL